MAITQRLALSAEWGDLREFDTSGAGLTASTTEAKTGTYSFRYESVTNSPGKIAFPATRQVRMGLHVFPGENAVPSVSAQFFALNTSGGTELLSVRAVENTVETGIYVAGTVQAVAAQNNYVWQHWGFDCKVHASAGWIRLWKDGVLILSFDGNTGNSDMAELQIGTTGTNRAFQSTSGFAYIDDIYLDDTTSETVALTAPADRRFLLAVPTSDSTPSDFTPSTGVVSWDLLDDKPIVTTTYIRATAAGVEDFVLVTPPALPTGFTTSAVWLQALAMKSNAAVASTLSLQTATVVGTAQSLGTSMAMRSERFATTDLTQKFGVRSDGAF